MATQLGGATRFATVGEPPPAENSPRVRVQRLSWAGIKIECGDTTIFIDPLISPEVWGGAWTAPIVPLTVNTARRHVLITHIHNDHFDPEAIRALSTGAPFAVMCHADRAAAIASRGFKVYSLQMYEPINLGDVTVCPVPAVDGFNEFQVSWIVTAAGKRMIHCGDTLWHGAFWQFGRQFGPIDVAFLPINGAKLLGVQPFSDTAATMTPSQAVAAAVVMKAKHVVPIHFGFHDPKAYLEHPNAEQEFRATADTRHQPYKVLASGEWMEL